MVVAEISITPVVGESMKPYVDAAIEVIRNSGLKYEVDAMGTTVEGDLEQVFETLKNAHQAVCRRGAERVLTEIKIDDKMGGVTIEDELEDYRASV